MKKITFLLMFIGMATVSHAQAVASTVSITQINGVATATFLSSHTNLIEGEVLTLTINYKNVLANPAETATFPNPRIRVRILNNYAVISGAVESTLDVTTLETVQTATVNVTVPDVTANIPIVLSPSSGARIQALAYGNQTTVPALGMVYGYSGAYSLNDLVTLSTENFNKNELASSYYKASNNAVIIGENIEGNYTIYDLSGKTVSKGKISSEINVSNLNSGVYVLSTSKGTLKFAK